MSTSLKDNRLRYHLLASLNCRRMKPIARDRQRSAMLFLYRSLERPEVFDGGLVRDFIMRSWPRVLRSVCGHLFVCWTLRTRR